MTDELQICQNFIERGRGLLWRPHLQASVGDALLIPKCNAVHTFWMQYPIAVIFLAKDGEVMKVSPRVRPWRYASCRKASFTLEVATGAAWVNRLQVGQKVRWILR